MNNHKVSILCVSVIIGCLFMASLAAAQPGYEKINKNILLFYSESNGNRYYSNEVSELLGIFLNYYGASVKYQNLDAGLGDGQLQDWADIYMVCQYQDTHPNGEKLCDFLLKRIGEKKIILIDLPGFPDKHPELFKKLGFICDGSFIDYNCVKKLGCVTEMSSGETALVPFSKNAYFKLTADETRKDVKTFIKAVTDTCETLLFASSDNGAVLFAEKLVAIDSQYVRRWMVDPYKVTYELLGGGLKVIPDPCVKGGNRVAYIHIDGDGFNYKTYYKDKRYSGEIIHEEIIEHYKLPTTASIIAAEINPADFGSAELEKKAAKMLKSQYVHPGVHGWYHPFDWEKMKNGSNEKLTEGTAEVDAGEKNDQIEDLKKFNPAWVVKEMSFQKEIAGSSNYISAISGKSCEIMLWTGMCNPTSDAIELCDKLNIYNMNGGDLRNDDESSAYSYMTPHYNTIGNLVRFNARYVNEFILTDKWTEPYDGFKKAIDGFKRTGEPKILTPIDIYYHFYSGMRMEGLDALKTVYDYVISLKPSFITAKEWIDRLKASMNCEIYEIKSGENFEARRAKSGFYNYPDRLKLVKSFSFCKMKGLDNLRWDHDGYPFIDPEFGVMGFNEINGSKYIILKPGIDSGEVHIVDSPPASVYLKSFNGDIKSVDIPDGYSKMFKVAGSSKAPFRLTIGNADFAYCMIEAKDSENNLRKYPGQIDHVKKEVSFDGDGGLGEIKVVMQFSTYYDNLYANLWNYVISGFQKINMPLVIVVLLYIYFRFTEKLRRKKENKKHE